MKRLLIACLLLFCAVNADAVTTNSEGSVVSTIKPAGGGDYTTLQAWEDAVDSATNPGQWAECFSGGDLGNCDMAIGWTNPVPTRNAYPRIYAEPGARHNGRSDSGGAYIYVNNDNGFAIVPDAPYTQIDGLRFVLNTTGMGDTDYITGVGPDSIPEGLIIENCLGIVSGTGTGSVQVLSLWGTGGSFTGLVVRNNAIYVMTALGSVDGINVLTAPLATGVAELYNNSVIGSGGLGNGFVWVNIGSDGELTIVSRNNVATGFGSRDFFPENHAAVTQTYCVSSDENASHWGGAGNQINVSLYSACISSNYLYPTRTSPLLDAGIPIASFTNDATHNSAWRPQGAAWDIGALERIAPGGVDFEVQFIAPYQGRMTWY